MAAKEQAAQEQRAQMEQQILQYQQQQTQMMQQMQQQQQMMQQQQAQMSWLMSQTALSSPPGSLPPPPYSMWMPPPPTQTPGTPITVNNMNIIRSMNLGESSCAQPATCTCSSVQYANANVHSINLLIDFMSQGNDNEAGGSGGGQG
jgi:TolA-binding protein